VVPICLHGDAAFTGQGIVAETLNLSELKGYRTGGTIHVIVNNQIGFTTPPNQGRFTPYPTDIAKAIQAPVFHVNGDDPEAVFHVSKLAIAFRQRFKQDVMIDLWCYRRYGHNEQDEPSFTQPLMYKAIKGHKSVREIYAQRLLDEGTVTEAELSTMREELLERFKSAREQAQIEKFRGKVPSFSGVWKGLGRAPEDYNDWEIDTRASRETLEKVVSPLAKVPSGFTIHPKLKKLLQGRIDAVKSGEGIDWGTGEMLALGSLLLEKTNVRFTGQDVERGTFSHRHQVLHDYNDGTVWRPLQHVGGGGKHENQGKLEIINTMLSEEAVLAFEWGFSSADPRNLVIWEAQFGDFVNGAQNLIDQILAAAEGKWRYMSGLVLNLPHGYEGQGPEHSNAYLERWLSLCADHNMQVAVPTTPAQYFHMLRRQIERPFRKPLILMMPKSLLRKADAASSIADFTERGLQLVIDDPELAADKRAEKVRRVILCSGKVYYTLEAARKEKGRHDVALVRVEQLYPFPETQIRRIVERYRKAGEIFWAQEEPQNRGAWSFIHPRLREMFPDRLVEYRGREASASPATGSQKMHALEESEFVEDALTSTGKAVTVAAGA
jgi:2-oxoglutarate dehydrogenase E1 component